MILLLDNCLQVIVSACFLDVAIIHVDLIERSVANSFELPKMHRNVKEVCIMKAAEFKDWEVIELLEPFLRERLERKAGADTIIELIEQRQNDERICPYQGTELYRWNK